jgi:hypothetical protein
MLLELIQIPNDRIPPLPYIFPRCFFLALRFWRSHGHNPGRARFNRALVGGSELHEVAQA